MQNSPIDPRTPTVIAAAGLYLAFQVALVAYSVVCLALFGQPQHAAATGILAAVLVVTLALFVFVRGRVTQYVCSTVFVLLLVPRLAALPLHSPAWSIKTATHAAHVGLLIWICWGVFLNPRTRTFLFQPDQTKFPPPSRAVGLWVFAFLAAFIALLVVDSTTGLRLDQRVFTILYILGVFAALWLALVFANRAFRRMQSDSHGYLRATLLLGGAIAAMILVARDPEVDEDSYGWEDLPVPAEDAVASHSVTLAFAKPCELDLGLAAAQLREEDWEEDVVGHASLIEQAWQETAAGRAIIDELNRFEAIADLQGDWEGPIPDFRVWRDLATTYAAMARLHKERGELRSAARTISTLESVARKSLPYNRSAVGKMIMIAIQNLATEVAFELVADPKYTTEVAGELAVFHTGLSDEMVSLRTPLMAERLATETASVSGYTGSLRPDHSLAWLMTPMFRSVYKPETCKRMIRESYDVLLHDATRTPPQSETSEAFIAELENRPRLLKLAPWAMVRVSLPSVDRMTSTANEARANSDLLALEINSASGSNIRTARSQSGR